MTEKEAAQLNADVEALQEKVFFRPGGSQVFSGDHTGKWFVRCDEKTETTPITGDTVLKDIQAFQEITAGLGSKVFVDPADLIDPNLPTEP